MLFSSLTLQAHGPDDHLLALADYMCSCVRWSTHLSAYLHDAVLVPGRMAHDAVQQGAGQGPNVHFDGVLCTRTKLLWSTVEQNNRQECLSVCNSVYTASIHIHSDQVLGS